MTVANGKTVAPQHITLADIAARRKRDGRLVAGTAALADIDSFKTATNWQSLPVAKRWDHVISPESQSREKCVLKQAAVHLKKPGMISLGGGLPSPENFPIESLTVEMAAGPDFGEGAAHEQLEKTTMGKYDTKEGKELDLAITLNYGQATGTAQLLRFVTEHTELVCRPPYKDWSVSLTIGSTGSLEQALRLLCDRARHDSMLTEAFSFSSALETALPLGIHIVGVPLDEQGLVPEAMDELLTQWNPAEHGGARKPHVLYTVPSGQNPTGATQSLERRQAVYKVCQKHDVYIIEDEPYYFLQMPAYKKAEERQNGNGSSSSDEVTRYKSNPEALLDELVPTMVSMDVDGRVMRLDSFSKVLAPGSRVGWVTASAQMIERYQRHAECCSQGPGGLTQGVLYQVLEQGWGHAGYLLWLANLRNTYTDRRNVLLDACHKYLPVDVVSWTPPAAGMFLWLRVDEKAHPDFGKKPLAAIEEDIFDRCIEKGVLVARGSWFVAEPAKPLEGLYFRTTFAAASHEAMDAAIHRFGDAVRGSFGKQ